MTDIYYATTFVDDGRVIDLISVGMVAANGGEYYAVSREFDHNKLMRRPWLMENVWPHLPRLGSVVIDWDHHDFKSREQIAAELREFITSSPDPVLWAFDAARHHVALTQLWGALEAHPAGVPTRTWCLAQEAARLSDPELPVQDPAAKHHALGDARHSMAVRRRLQQVRDRRHEKAVRRFAEQHGLDLTDRQIAGALGGVS